MKTRRREKEGDKIYKDSRSCHLGNFLMIRGLICARTFPSKLKDTFLPLVFHTTKKEA